MNLGELRKSCNKLLTNLSEKVQPYMSFATDVEGDEKRQTLVDFGKSWQAVKESRAALENDGSLTPPE